MRRRPPLAIVNFALLVVTMPPAAADLPDPDIPGLHSMLEDRAFVSGEVIVRFDQGVGPAARAAALDQIGATQESILPWPGTLVARLPRGTSVPEASAELERRPDVLSAEPNVIHRVSGMPNDPMFGDLWGLHQPSDADIDAPEAWDVTRGTRGVVVAVVDTGVSYNHPDLAPNIWTNDDPPGGGDQDGNGRIDDTHGWDFVEMDNTPFDHHGHGTHVAGAIGARGNNDMGITGVNWRVSIMPLRAGDGRGTLTATRVAAAFKYACAEGADIVNGSFSSEMMSSLVRDAVLGCPGTLFIFAAGNDGWDLDQSGVAKDAFPCELHRPPTSANNVLCVGATDPSDEPATFSNHGSAAVHLAAPGAGILSASPTYRTVWGPDGFDDPTQADFDDRWGDRTPDDAAWGRTEEAHSPPYSLTDSPGGQYANGTDATIQTRQALNLSGRAGCRIDHLSRYETQEFWDRFNILAARTRNPKTWALIGSWHGSTGGVFQRSSSDLSRFDGGSVFIRLHFESNNDDVVDDGVYVDDLLVKCLEPGGEDYGWMDSTSMATAYASGVAALVLAWDPVRTVGNLKSALTASVDRLPSLTDKAISGGRLNAAKALQMPKTKIVKLKASRKVVRKGMKVRLTATVRPCAGHEGEFVRFQRKGKGGWKSIGERTTNDRCKAKRVLRLTKTTVFRAISPQQDDDHLRGVSRRVRVRIRR